MQADVENPLELYPKYTEWLAVYDNVREFCDFVSALEFLGKNPETINNRKGGPKGWTILYQAAFWGIDRGILEQLRALGANPCLQDYENRTAFACAQSNQSKEDFVAVFGKQDGLRDAITVREILQKASLVSKQFIAAAQELPDAEIRHVLSESAKMGDFAMTIRLITLFPFLCNHQGPTGWGVLHQACFHGTGRGLFSKLRQLGVSSVLKTNRGETATMIVQQNHANTAIPNIFDEVFGQASSIAGKAVEPGCVVHYAMASGTCVGTIERVNVDAGAATLRTADGRVLEGPLWRMSVLEAAHGDGSADLVPEEELSQLMAGECVICSQPTLPLRISPACDHDTCAECCVNSLWASFTGGTLPPTCGICHGKIDPPDLYNRSIAGSWAAKHPDLPYRVFCTNLAEKQTRVLAGPIQWEDLDAATRTLYETEMKAGRMMRCLNGKCGQTFTKETGCNFVQCFFCRTEHCWQKKMLAGKGPGTCGGGHGCHY